MYEVLKSLQRAEMFVTRTAPFTMPDVIEPLGDVGRVVAEQIVNCPRGLHQQSWLRISYAGGLTARLSCCAQLQRQVALHCQIPQQACPAALASPNTSVLVMLLGSLKLGVALRNPQGQA